MAKNKSRKIKSFSDLSSWNFIIFLTLAFMLIVSVAVVLSKTSYDIRSRAGGKTFGTSQGSNNIGSFFGNSVGTSGFTGENVTGAQTQGNKMPNLGCEGGINIQYNECTYNSVMAGGGKRYVEGQKPTDCDPNKKVDFCLTYDMITEMVAKTVQQRNR